MFVLRQADHLELIRIAGTTSIVTTKEDASDAMLIDTDLSSLFGIDIGSATENNSPKKLIIKRDRAAPPKKKIKKKGESTTVKKVSKKAAVKIKKKSVVDVGVKKKMQKKSKSPSIKKSVNNKKLPANKMAKKKK